MTFVGIKGDLSALEEWSAAAQLNGYSPLAEKRKNKTILSQLAQQLISDTKGLIKIVQNEPLNVNQLCKNNSFLQSG